MSHIIAPSILSADFANLGKEISAIDQGGGDWIHIDVMDGCFVPDITIGPLVVKALRPYTKKMFDIHLMVKNPDDFLEPFARAGADILTVHEESCVHLDRTLCRIRDLGCRAGVSLNPSTSERNIDYVLSHVDLILVMTVNPGFGNQIFLDSQLAKIQRIRRMIGSDSSIRLEVDGGINEEKITKVAEAGADTFVSGSYIFSGVYSERIAVLRKQAQGMSDR